MVVSVASCKSKMVVIFATALALGVSAVAACVVPWLYCKPADGADDDREPTAIDEDNADSQSRSNNEHDRTMSTVGLRVDGSNFVKVYINPRSTANPDIAEFSSRQNETANSTSIGEYLPENPISAESRSPVRPDDIRPQCLQDVQTCISGVSNFVSTAMDTKNSEASGDVKASSDARSVEAAITSAQISESNSEHPDSMELASSNATESTEESSVPHSLEVVVKDIRVVESRMPNSASAEPSLMVNVEFNGTDTLQTSQSSNPNGESSTDTLQTTESSKPTYESSTETTLTASSGSSGHDRSESNVQSDEQSAEETRSSTIARCDQSTSRIAQGLKMEYTESKSSHPGLLIPKTLEPVPNELIKEDSLTPLRKTNPSDSRNSSAERKAGTFASRELERSFSSSKGTAISAIESSKISKDLNTIPEVTWCSESSNETSPRAGCTENSASPKSLPSNDPKNDSERFSRQVRIVSRLSSGFKRFLHGMRLDRTSRSSLEELHQELHTESVHSVSAGEKLPAGHSTLVPEDERLLKNIRRRRSMTSYVRLPKPLEDPRIFLHDHRNVIESGSHGNEEPLDLSIRSSSVPKGKTKDSSACKEKDLDGTSDSSIQIFCEVIQYSGARISRISKNGTSSAASLNFRRDTSKSDGRDGNQNFISASSTAVIDAHLDENRECISDSEACLNFPEMNDRKLKLRNFLNIFKFGKIDRSKGKGTVSCCGRKKTGANSVPVEFQRNSMVINSNPGVHPNANLESINFESRANSRSYQELDFGILDDERNLREPCTEL